MNVDNVRTRKAIHIRRIGCILVMDRWIATMTVCLSSATAWVAMMPVRWQALLFVR